MDVFSEDSDRPLGVVICCPSRVCNYRCAYCERTWRRGAFSDLKFDSAEFAQWDRWLDIVVSRIRRPLCLVTHPNLGEPLVVPGFFDSMRRIAASENVRSISIVSNLSHPIMDALTGIDPRKFGIKASLHPSQFKSPGDFGVFVEQALAFKRHGGTILIGYVFSRDQIPKAEWYRDFFNAMGLPFSGNLLMGTYEGITFPDAYTDDERRVLSSFFADEPFIFDYQVANQFSFGKPCAAGRDCIYVTNDGSVYRCQFTQTKLGALVDGRLDLPDGNLACTSERCRCHYTIGLMEDIYRDYRKGVHIMVGYEKRKDDAAADHPFL